MKEMSLYDKVVEFVDTAFAGKQKRHFERTVFWLEKFLPNITDTERIAAYAHDIERGVNGEKDRDYLDPIFIKIHQEEGARIIGEFLSAQGATAEMIQRIKHLIGKHEVGGDAEQNALMDADSVSYFETNAEMFVNERVKEDGYQKVKGKLDWMFNRISTDERKEFAKENYTKWSKKLESNSPHPLSFLRRQESSAIAVFLDSRFRGNDNRGKKLRCRTKVFREVWRVTLERLRK